MWTQEATEWSSTCQQVSALRVCRPFIFISHAVSCADSGYTALKASAIALLCLWMAAVPLALLALQICGNAGESVRSLFGGSASVPWLFAHLAVAQTRSSLDSSSLKRKFTSCPC